MTRDKLQREIRKVRKWDDFGSKELTEKGVLTHDQTSRVQAQFDDSILGQGYSHDHEIWTTSHRWYGRKGGREEEER